MKKLILATILSVFGLFAFAAGSGEAESRIAKMN